jgi:hypothetical protein
VDVIAHHGDLDIFIEFLAIDDDCIVKEAVISKKDSLL